MADGVVYLVGVRGLRTDGATGNGALHIGRYALFDEDAGGQPPYVSITAPAAVSQVEERTFVTVSVDARDDVRIESVTLTVDGEAIGTDYSAPYEFQFRVPAGPTTALRAIARDGAGTESVSERVLPVLANNAPVATIRVPANGQEVPTGHPFTVFVDATDDQEVLRVDLLVNGSVVASRDVPPYRFERFAPAAGPQYSLSAVAYDDLGPSEVAGPVNLVVTYDQPPTAVVLEPGDGAEVVEGSLVAVIAGVGDDVGIDRVQFFVDGVRVGTLSGAPPYRVLVEAPAAGSAMELQVVARDTALHETVSTPVTVVSITDPLTRVEGRVLGETRSPLAGIDVDCGEAVATTGADGRFALDGFPTGLGTIHCAADYVTPAGELRHVVSPGRAPVAGGVTDVGDLSPSRLLLYGGFGRGSFSRPGAVVLFSDATLEGQVLGDGADPAGLTGLAFDSSGRLFGATLDGPQEARTSNLVEIDPDSGEVIADIGPIAESSGGLPMSLGDLAFDPASGDLLGLRSLADGAAAGGRIYRIDLATGEAELLGDSGTGDGGGLACSADGTLYLTSFDAGQSVLRSLSPADAATLSQVTLPDFFDGLAVRPSDGLLFATLGGTSGVYTLDPVTGSAVEVGFSDLGQASDLAFRAPLAVNQETTVVGRVVDQDSEPIEGARVTALGSFAALSGADGRFVVSHVPVVFGDVTAVVPPSALSSSRSESEPAFPVPEGVTDVGDIVVLSGVSFLVPASRASGD